MNYRVEKKKANDTLLQMWANGELLQGKNKIALKFHLISRININTITTLTKCRLAKFIGNVLFIRFGSHFCLRETTPTTSPHRDKSAPLALAGT